MREFALRKDGKARFYHLDSGNLLIVDEAGYHEYCGSCRRVVFEFAHGEYTEPSCKCPAATASVVIEQVITQLYHSLDLCQDIESVKRMLITLAPKKEVSHV